MSDLVNDSEMTNESPQPDQAVAAESEESLASPQAEDTPGEVFVIEEESDQSQEAQKDNDLIKRQAAFAERKRKEREAKEEARREREARERVEKELLELRQEIGNIKRGSRPDPLDYASTDDFYAALDEWQSRGNTTQEKQTEDKKPSQAVVQQDYEAEFKFDEGSKRLKSGGISDFDDKVSAVKQTLEQIAPGMSQNVFNHIMSVAAAGGVDPAKAVYMIGRDPQRILNEMNSVNAPNDFARDMGIKRIMEREAAKLKLRSNKSVETQPEPSVPGGSMKKSDPLAKYGHFEN